LSVAILTIIMNNVTEWCDRNGF